MHEKITLGGSLMLAPVPVVLVASAHPKLGSNLMTVAWCGVDCSDPPTVHVSIRPSRFSYRMIEESGCFTLNIPTRELLVQVDLCGLVSGKDGDKFERAGLTRIDAEVVSAPLVKECPVNIECKVDRIIKLGLHDMFLGQIVAKHADASCIEDGKVNFSDLALITYVDGEYWALGERIGLYGCSSERV